MSEPLDDVAHPRRLLTDAQALAEAQRCQGCVDAACTRGCPLDVDVGAFIRRIRTANPATAFRSLRSRNPLPETTALICPVEELCQGSCTSGQLDRPVNIHLLQRYAAHRGRQFDQPPSPNTGTAHRVAIVGAGPAGLACAAGLAEQGIAAEIFEAHDKPGGALVRWIPPHRLPRDVVTREIDDILHLAAKLHVGEALARDFSLDELFERHFKAVFLAMGLPAGMPSRLAGRHGPQIVEALDYLQQHAAGSAPAIGATTVVIGGGSTAVDAAACAKLAGARDVYLIYRRSFEQMPAWPHDRRRAIDLGIHLLILVRPIEYVRNDDGALVGVRCVRTQLAEPQGPERREPIDVPGSQFALRADLVIEALGQQLDAPLRSSLGDLRFNRDGTVWTHPETGATSRPGVFAGGDLANTDRTVVHALANGLRAADAMVIYLSGK